MIAKVTPFSFDDDPMHSNQKSRRTRPTLLALSAATLMTLAPLAAEADSDRHHRHGHGHGRGEYKEKYWDGAASSRRKTRCGPFWKNQRPASSRS